MSSSTNRRGSTSSGGRPGGSGGRSSASGGRPGESRTQQRARTATERQAAAAARREAERKREQRRRALVGGAVAVVAALVVVGVVLLVRGGSSGGSSSASSSSTLDVARQVIPSTPTGTTTTQKAVKRVKDDSGIKGVLAWDTGDWPGAGTSTASGILEHQHVTGPVTYGITPPVGGPHNATWMNAGVYTKPVPNERAVHNLEHGAVWITYDPDLPAAQVKALRALVAKQSLIDESKGSGISGQESRYMDLSPWTSSTLPSKIVMSAWGHQLRVSSPSDPRLQQFIDTFRNSKKYSPEYGSAVDGIPTGIGGVPAADGATKANPSGSGDSGSGASMSGSPAN